ETIAIRTVEIDPRRRRDTRLFEEGFAEFEGIIGEAADACIGVERTVARGRQVKADIAQALRQQRAVLGVMRLLLFRIVALAESNRRRDLAEGGRRDEEVLLEDFRAADQVLGQYHPADAPAGHAVIFRKTVDDYGVPSQLKGADGG